MVDLKSLYLKHINGNFTLAVASNPATAGAEEADPGDIYRKASKVKVRPVMLKTGRGCQVTATLGQKEVHANMDEEAAAQLLARLTGAPFKQVEIKDGDAGVTVLVSKKGKQTVKERLAKTAYAADGNTGAVRELKAEETPLMHNRKKNYVLPEGEPVPFLVELGVMTRSGRVVAAKYDKFRQINRYLEFVEDIIPSLPTGREISIIDFGCGKSYLTFALYYYLSEKKGFNIRVTGLDLKEDVIAECNALAQSFGYDKLTFLHGDIAYFEGCSSADMVVTLHACDTATDYALYKAIKWGARVIFCVPCCQHELNRQIKNENCRDIFKYGLIKERMAALCTDALRANILEEQGYRTQILEFIDMEHTPKNILIRAVRQDLKIRRKSGYENIMKELNVSPTLYRLLHPQE